MFLVATALTLGLLTVGQYGATWDEEHSMRQGSLLVRWYASGLQDRRVIDDSNYRYYGGFFNTIVALAHLAGTPLYETSHVATVLCGAVGLALAYWIGATLGCRFSGFFSTLFLWMTPFYYGHTFNNPKDLPFAVGMLASLAAIMACWEHLPRLPPGPWIRTGLIIGMTLGIRVGALLNLLYLGLIGLAWLALHGSAHVRDEALDAASPVATLAKSGIKIALLACSVMLPFWPYTLEDPFSRIWQTVAVSAHFTDWIHPVRFAGADVLSNQLPWSYVPTWFAVTLPEFYFVAGAAGALQIPEVAAAFRGGQFNRHSAVLSGLLAVAILGPIATIMVSHSILYNGVRHLLFVAPLLAIASGLCLSSFLKGTFSRALRLLGLALTAVSLIMTALDMVRLHPYQSVYFNRLVAGGLRHASSRFETDYWGQSYKEGVDWLLAHYDPDADEPIRVANCSTAFLTGYYLTKAPGGPDRFVSVEPNARPHVVLATTRWFCYDQQAARVLHVVKRMGVPLAYVVEVRPPHSAQRAVS